MKKKVSFKEKLFPKKEKNEIDDKKKLKMEHKQKKEELEAAEKESKDKVFYHIFSV